MTDNQTSAKELFIKVDGEQIPAKPGQLLIQACLDAGVYVPHFCYHPRMNPVGMCRMCLVEVDSGRGANLEISCTLPVAENMEVVTKSDKVAKAQDGILEFLLLNHPLDCPVCDKGGECPLQDQTMAFGPGESRFVEEKRHFVKPIPISSQVYLDRERCILCDRCTRFADEVAGDALISFQGRGQNSEVNTFPDSEFSSYFSGNTVQICPVGALTAEPYRFKARPWDLNEKPSTYPNPMGDQVVIQASNNRMVRILGADSDPLNWGWLTDKDRFGFQALSSPNRIAQPLVRKAGELVEVPWYEALAVAAKLVDATLTEKTPDGLAILGGASLANEDQYAWAKLSKGIWGTDNVNAQMDDGIPAEVVLGLPRTTIDQAFSPESVVVFVGADLKEDLGTLYLRLRHGIINDQVSLIELTPTKTGLTDLAAHSFRIFPGEALDAVERLITGNEGSAGDYKTAAQVVSKAADEGKLTVIYGRPSLAESPGIVSEAVQVLAKEFPSARFLPILRNGNIFGALDMGLAPGILPGRVSLEAGEKWFFNAWGRLPKEPGKSTSGILSDIAVGKITTLILLGEDPLGDICDAQLLEQAINSSSRPAIIALDKFMSPYLKKFADVVLPTAGFGERSGTHTNLEGRICSLGELIAPPGTVRCEWEIAVELASLLDIEMDFTSLESIWAEIQELSPQHFASNYDAIISNQDGWIPPGLHPNSTADKNTDDSLNASSGTSSDMGETKLPSKLNGFEHTFNETGIAKDNYSHRLIVQRPMYGGEIWTTECRSLAMLGADSSHIRLHPDDLKRLGIPPGSSVEVQNLGRSKKGNANARTSPLVLIADADPSLPASVAEMSFTPSTLRNDAGDPHVALLVDSSLTVNDVLIQLVRPADVDPFSR